MTRSFAEEAIRTAPQKQSPWNYLRGIVTAAKQPLSSLQKFAAEFAAVDEVDTVRSSHALDLLAEIYGSEKDGAEKAGKAYDLLATKYDPIRANYWNYLKGQLGQGEVAA